jgi:hypothetical protein
VLDVVVEDVLRERLPGVAAGGGIVPAAIMSRMSPMPASPLSGSASRRTILMPLYSFGLCDAVICAPPSRPSRATAKYSMSVPIIP